MFLKKIPQIKSYYIDVSRGKTAQKQIRTYFVLTAKVHTERTVDWESEA